MKSIKIKINILVILVILFSLFFINKKSDLLEASNNSVSVTIIYNDLGSVNIGLYNKDTDARDYFNIQGSDNKIIYTYNYGDYVLLNAIPNVGKEFLYWYEESNDFIVLKSEAKTRYFKAVEDVTIYAFFKGSDDHIITYMDSSISKNIYMIEIVGDGESGTGYGSLKKKGFDFKEWSPSINNVHDDINVYPEFKYNIFTVFRDYWSFFLIGLLKTLLFSIIAVALSIVLGAVICFMRLSKVKAINYFATGYVEAIRGIPSLLLLLIIYAIVPRIEIGFLNTEIIACILALFINSSAYMAEIYRAGIQAVDKGQSEAARALGMGYWETMFKIIIPQAIRNVLPSIGNELIMVIKETSLASQIDAGIGELMSVKKQITSATYINLEPYFIIAFIYFIVTFSLSKVVRKIEKRLDSREK